MNIGLILKKIKLIIKKNYPLLIIFAFVLIPLGWFKKNLPIAAGDNYFYLGPDLMLPNFFYSWFDRYQAGLPNLSVAQVFPFMFFWWIFKLFGFLNVEIQRLWVFSYFILSGISIYFLTIYIAKKIKFDNNLIINLGAILSAVLYMINMFIAIDVTQPGMRPVQSVLPLTILLWMKGLETKKFKYSFLVAASTLLFASSNINLATVSPLFLVMFVYLIFLIIVRRENILSILKFSILTFILYFLLNLWWIQSFFSGIVSMSKEVKTAASAYNFLGYSSLFEAFRFLGFWAWKSTYEGISLVPYADKYHMFPLSFSTFLIPFFAFLIYFKKTNFYTIFLGIISIIGLFLIKGILPPLGGIYLFLFKYMPGFWVYREPFTKFTLITVFSISCLLGLSFMFCLTKFHENGKKFINEKIVKPSVIFFWLIIIGIVLYNSFPLVTGEVIWDRNYKVMRSIYADIPTYWAEIREWFKNNNVNNTRTLLLPKTGYGHAYIWKSGISTAGPVAQVLLGKPVIGYNTSPTLISEDGINKIYNSLNYKKEENLINIIGFYNVEYILQDNDIDHVSQLSGLTFSPEQVKKILSYYPEIYKIKSFGKLDLYKIKDEYLQPKIYVADGIVYSQVSLDVLIQQRLPFLLKNKAVIMSDKLGSEQQNEVLSSLDNYLLIADNIGKSKYKIKVPIINNNIGSKGNEEEKEISYPSDIDKIVLILSDKKIFGSPSISFQQNNPTSYLVDIKGNKNKFMLVFSESYSKNWKAFIGGKEIPESRHFMVNGYSNGWLVENQGDFNLNIIYSSQKYLKIALYVSTITFLGSILFAISKLKKIKH